MLIPEKDVDKIINLYREGGDPIPNFRTLLPELPEKFRTNKLYSYVSSVIMKDANKLAGANVYGFLFGKDHLKIGYSTNIKIRKSAVARTAKLKFNLDYTKTVFLFPCENEYAAEHLESGILRFLWGSFESKGNGDWFSYKQIHSTILSFWLIAKSLYFETSNAGLEIVPA